MFRKWNLVRLKALAHYLPKGLLKCRNNYPGVNALGLICKNFADRNFDHLAKPDFFVFIWLSKRIFHEHVDTTRDFFLVLMRDIPVQAVCEGFEIAAAIQQP
ncbi:MAG: hypothetical protein B6D41_01050 [Chloroflexi bacterium UTCFX4]|nr:MAG: hypothetical protein B6D41_01050 [Chloroflexi bacterium UTCFX4]